MIFVIAIIFIAWCGVFTTVIFRCIVVPILNSPRIHVLLWHAFCIHCAAWYCNLLSHPSDIIIKLVFFCVACSNVLFINLDSDNSIYDRQAHILITNILLLQIHAPL